jgi:hypothetical protein
VVGTDYKLCGDGAAIRAGLQVGDVSIFTERGSVGALALVGDDQVARLAIFWPATPAGVAVAEEDDNLAQVHRDSPVEMFFDYLARVHTAVVQCVTAQLVDQGELQLI